MGPADVFRVSWEVPFSREITVVRCCFVRAFWTRRRPLPLPLLDLTELRVSLFVCLFVCLWVRRTCSVCLGRSLSQGKSRWYGVDLSVLFGPVVIRSLAEGGGREAPPDDGGAKRHQRTGVRSTPWRRGARSAIRGGFVAPFCSPARGGYWYCGSKYCLT